MAGKPVVIASASLVSTSTNALAGMRASRLNASFA